MEGKKKRDSTNGTCYGCGKKGHLQSTCKEKEESSRDGKNAKKNIAGTSSNSLSGTLLIAMTHTGPSANRSTSSLVHIDLGASDYLVPSKGRLRAYQKFATLAAANGGENYAYSNGFLRMATSVVV